MLSQFLCGTKDSASSLRLIGENCKPTEWQNFNLKEAFICDYCRNICKAGCHEEMVERLKTGKINPTDPDFYPRKQIITCLGKYCQHPCQYQREETDLTMEQLINLVKFLGTKLNEFLIKKDS